MTLKTGVSQEDLVALGKRVKELRRYLRLSQKELAASMSMTNSYLSEIEHGKAYPAFDFFHKISRKFNVDLNYLFHGMGEMFISCEEHPEKHVEWVEDIRSIDDLLWFMEHSSMFRNSIMGLAVKFLIENEPILKKNVQTYISEYKLKMEEKKDDETNE